MGLSADPEKRARSLANLKRGRNPPSSTVQPAAEGLPVAGYGTPAPRATPQTPPAAGRRGDNVSGSLPRTRPASSPASGDGAGGGDGFPWLIVGGGALLLIVLVLVLQRTGAPK